MAISQSVIESIREAESHLRNALAYSARQESPYVPLALSEIIFKLDTLLGHDRFMDKIESVKENFRGGIDLD
jgi:hypothetical protein